MSHPHFGLRATLALLLLGGLVAGHGLAQGEAKAGDKAGGDKAAGDKDGLEKVRQELKQLRQKVKDQQKELQALQERLKSLEAGRFGAPPFQPPFFQPGGFPTPPGMAKGKILKIDKEDKTKVTVSLTKKDGIRVGQRLMVLRTKVRRGPVAMIEVTEVGDKESTGKLHPFGPNREAAVEAGDEVFAMPGGPGGFPGGPGGFPGGPGAFPGGAPPIKAKVSKVDKDKKVITLTLSGEAAKLTAGQMLMAVRMGERPRRLGLFKVTEANAKQVVGQLTAGAPGEEGAELREGDEVQLMGGPLARPVPGGLEAPPPPPPPPLPKSG